MIVVDGQRQYPNGLGPKRGPSCHMLSTLPGPAGTVELLEFGKRIGLRPSWLQRAGTYLEHFDLFGGRRARAVSIGATEIPRSELARILRAKRKAFGQVVDLVRAELDAGAR